MLNLPHPNLAKIKRYLLRRQKEVDEAIQKLEKEDPVLVQTVAEATESGTESWAADVHARAVAIKDDLISFSRRIADSLANLRRGTYGKCEKCGRAIEAERLEALPTATLCLSCSKKPATRGTKKK